MNRSMLLVGLIVLFASCSKDSRLIVKQGAQPDYPSPARYENIQGTVQVEVAIGTAGNVVSAKSSGGNWILQKAAEENARQWVFGPFPRVAEFPMYHTITNVYRLEGKPFFVAVTPHVRMYLPDRVEIVATPLVSDYPPLSEDKSVPKN